MRCALVLASLAGVASGAAEKAKKPEPAAKTEAPPEAKLIEGYSWREIGPFRGGRVTAVTGVAGQPQVYYMGATGGGVFKTTNGGTSWAPMTDGQMKPGSARARARAAHTGRARDALDPPRPRPPAQPRPRVRGRSRAHLGPQPGARRLPLEGRRQDVVEGAVRRRQDGRRGPRDGSLEPERALRGHLAGAAHALEPRERRPGKRSLQDDGRRRHLEEARRQG